MGKHYKAPAGRFNTRIREFFFHKKKDFLGRGDQGLVFRAYRKKDLASEPFALKIIRKKTLKQKCEKK